MKTRLILATLFGFVLALPFDAFAQGFSGAICFRNGTTVDFDYMGDKEEIYDAYLNGKLGKRRVRYRFEELKEIYFLETNKSYSKENENWYGSVMIEHRKKEKRFTLTDCWIHVGDQSGALYYVYSDTCAKMIFEDWTNIIDEVSHILIGEHSGNFKYNPRTKQYFPPSFLYDPYTGEKLEWIQR